VLGSQFVQSIRNLPAAQREEAVYQAAARGDWVVWPMTMIIVQDRGHEVGFVVSDDYLAIGTPQDYVRMPMNPLTAQRIADKLGFQLPTPKMVDLIWRAAAAKVEPRPLQQQLNPKGIPTGIVMWPGGQGGQPSVDAAAAHSALVDQQFAAGGNVGGIRGGHKKDVVLSNRLQGMATVKEVTGPPKVVDASKQVAIYGWHRGLQHPPSTACSKFPITPGLCPIQGLSIVHDNQFQDYSHGIRMVSPEAMLDGQSARLIDLLTDPRYASILNHDGVLRVIRQPHVPFTPGFQQSATLMPQLSKLPKPSAAVKLPARAEIVVAGAGGSIGWIVAAATAALGYYGARWWHRRS
jgi:hypothetical protein